MGLEGAVIFFLVLSSLMVVGYCHADYSCQPLNCTSDGPVIRFPFRLKGLQPQHCGYPGFDLSCKGNDTVMHISSLARDVSVSDISYNDHRLTFFDPKDCLWSLLFFNNNLNLFPTHLSYYDRSTSYSYTFLNCSKSVDFPGTVVDCLSDREHDVFIVYAGYYVVLLPESCQPIKTVAIPSPYYYSLSGSLDLKWDVPGCNGCDESRGGKCELKDQNSTDTICFYPPNLHHGSRRRLAIIGASLGSFLLLASIVASMKVFHSWKLVKKLDLENEIKVEKFLEEYKSLKPTRYSYADLKKMTDQFKEKLGQGGYGTVFKGKLPNGTSVAVKILKMIGGDGGDFINEVGTIGTIHHVNVVRLLGFCADRLKRALIYEFMPNESLEKFIFSRNTSDHFFSWEKLQDIAIGVARGIEYLHQGCDQRILHFDIKPHNILLDQNFNPKICDFGLAKLCSKGKSAVSMTAARGTMGYIAPEVFSRNFGNVSYKSDVYSFGMLLLEMVGGRKNIDVTVENTSQVYFPEWIYKRLHQGEEMDLNFATDEDAKIAKKLTIVALWCIQWNPVDRPSMESVVQMFEGNMESLVIPPDPFASTGPARTGVEKTQITNLSTISE